MQLHIKNLKKNTLRLFIASLFMVSFYSCSDDDIKVQEEPDTPDLVEEEPDEPVETRLKTGYIIYASSPNGDAIVKYFEEIPTGTADLTDGQTFANFDVNDVFDGYIFADKTLDDRENISRVQVNLDGKVEQAGSIASVNSSGIKNRVKIANETTGITADDNNVSQITIFNPTTMEVTGLIDMSTEDLPNTQYFFDFLVRGDELFAYVKSATNEAFTSYYIQSANYKTGQFIKTTKFPDVSFNNSLFEENNVIDEQGNMYLLNSGELAKSVLLGAIYKIPTGSNDFDLDYNLKPAQIVNPTNFIAPITRSFNYIANDIAVATAVTETPQSVIDIITAAGGIQNLTLQQQIQVLGLFTTEEVVKWVSINVKTQEVSIIPGLPAQSGFGGQTSILINGEVYLEIGSENAAYKYNPTTGVTEKAFDVNGGTYSGIVDLSAN